MSMQNSIKIYGERNTGTNYLTHLLELNLKVDIVPGVVPQHIMEIQAAAPDHESIRDKYFESTMSSNLGWKHMLVKPASWFHAHHTTHDNVSFVTLTRNPYSWLLSLYDRPYHQYYSEKPDFETFLTLPWKTVGRECAPDTLPNPIELWNIKNSAYLRLNGHLPVLNIKFEDLIADPNKVITSIGNTFSYQWITKVFINHEKSTKDSSRDYFYYREYYANENWKPRLTPLSIAIINHHLDKQLLSAFTYEKLA